MTTYTYFYGVENNYINISHLITQDNLLTIPKNDIERAGLFGDPKHGVSKHILIKNNENNFTKKIFEGEEISLTTKYKIIFVIIYSNNALYSRFKHYLFMLYSKYSNDIKFYFVENTPQFIKSKYQINGTDFYVNGHENTKPGIYLKTFEAINFINQNFDYDYLIRTNISTIYNIPKIINYLNNKPKIKFATGYILNCIKYGDFIHGTSIIISKDVANMILQPHNFSLKLPDDVLLSYIIKSYGINFEYFDLNYINFLIYNNYNENKILLNNDTLFYRVKNMNNRNIDLQYFDLIFNFLNKN